MKKKVFLILLPVLLALSVCSYFYDGSFLGYDLEQSVWSVCFGVFLLSAFWWIFSQGSFRKSSWVRLAYIGLTFCITGALFTTQRWPYGRAILMTGSIIAGIGNIFHFVKKPAKGFLDWVKVIFVILLFSSVLLKQQHSEHTKLVQWCMFFSEMTLIVSFYIAELRPPAKQLPALETEGTHIFKQDE